MQQILSATWLRCVNQLKGYCDLRLPKITEKKSFISCAIYTDSSVTVKFHKSYLFFKCKQCWCTCNRKGENATDRLEFEPGPPESIVRCSTNWAIWPLEIEPSWPLHSSLLNCLCPQRHTTQVLCPWQDFHLQFQGWSTAPNVTGREKMQQTRPGLPGFEPGPPQRHLNSLVRCSTNWPPEIEPGRPLHTIIVYI